MTRGRAKAYPKWIGVIAAAIIAITFLALVAPHLFSLIRPPITWVKPYMLHIGEVDLTGILLTNGPFSYAWQSMTCPQLKDRDIYFTSSKPPGIEQWDYVQKEDSWAWFIDPVSADGCAPNVGLAFKLVSQDNPDPISGLMKVVYDYEVVLSCDPWAGGAVCSPECGAAYKDSYFIVLIDSPYYVYKVYIDGAEGAHGYESSGKVKLIIPITHGVPSTLPVYEDLPSWFKALTGPSLIKWVETGRHFKHRMEIVVQTGVVQEFAKTTIMPEWTWSVGPTGIVTIYGTRSTVYTAPVPTTTTFWITEYKVVSPSPTVINGQTVTIYISQTKTVYDTRTFTLPIVVTKETTVTVTEPKEITMVRTVRVTKTVTETEEVPFPEIIKETPGWVWLLMGAMVLLVLISSIMNIAGKRARSGRRGRRIRR